MGTEYHMYVWSMAQDFIAVAQGRSVAEARNRMLEEIGESGDGSCPERDAARKWVTENSPNVWRGRNAEFALTDSAELREQEAYSKKLHDDIGALSREERNKRQKAVSFWCSQAFGAEHASSVKQRALRLLEEAMEAYQAAGCEEKMAMKLLFHVFDREPGKLSQELGGIGITLLALAEAAGISADAEERREFERVLAKPREHFAARNQAKNDAGFEVK